MRSGASIPNVLSRPGVALLPEDFPKRLAALKEITGLTWEGMACSIGVDPRQLHRERSRKGGNP